MNCSHSFLAPIVLLSCAVQGQQVHSGQLRSIAVGAAAATATARPTAEGLQLQHGLAHEIIQGPLVKYSRNSNSQDVPTAVFVHGILGSRRNLGSFAKMLIEVREAVPVSFQPPLGCIERSAKPSLQMPIFRCTPQADSSAAAHQRCVLAACISSERAGTSHPRRASRRGRSCWWICAATASLLGGDRRSGRTRWTLRPQTCCSC